ncbi:MAG: hypothetical protein IPP95_00010 [Flavobacteriales bacterium]|nr:MAG: hypothetical protein IPP95_00010 [Flavobacteriales bacterium]
MESLVDDIAHRNGTDPVEMRMKNFEPHTSPSVNTASLPTAAATRSRAWRSGRWSERHGNRPTDMGRAGRIFSSAEAHCRHHPQRSAAKHRPPAGFRWLRTDYPVPTTSDSGQR